MGHKPYAHADHLAKYPRNDAARPAQQLGGGVRTPIASKEKPTAPFGAETWVSDGISMVLDRCKAGKRTM